MQRHDRGGDGDDGAPRTRQQSRTVELENRSRSRRASDRSSLRVPVAASSRDTRGPRPRACRGAGRAARTGQHLRPRCRESGDQSRRRSPLPTPIEARTPGTGLSRSCDLPQDDDPVGEARRRRPTMRVASRTVEPSRVRRRGARRELARASGSRSRSSHRAEHRSAGWADRECKAHWPVRARHSPTRRLAPTRVLEALGGELGVERASQRAREPHVSTARGRDTATRLCT